MITLRNMLFAGTALLGLAAAGHANATAMTQTITVGGGTASVTTDLNQIAFNNSITLFNSASIVAAHPGNTVTLNDVILTLNTVASTSGTVKNTATQAQSFQFDLTLTSYIGGGSQTNAASAQNITTGYFGQFDTGSIKQDFGTATYSNLGSGQTAAYPQTGSGNVSTSPATTLTDANSLAAFTGTGSYALNLSTSSGQTFNGGGGNTSASLNTQAGASFTVEYDYTLTPIVVAVPEPASLALLGAGLVGIAMLRRRARS